MTAPHIDLDRLEALAKAATPGEWVHSGVAIMSAGGSFTIAVTHFPGMLGSAAKSVRARNAEYIAAANPAAIKELVARLRRAEADAAWMRGVVDAARQNQKELLARAEHAEAIANREVPPMATCPKCLTVHDPRLGQPDPNDPLDDVLPLPAERTSSSGTWTKRVPLPLNLPASLDLDPTEGGSHD